MQPPKVRTPRPVSLYARCLLACWLACAVGLALRGGPVWAEEAPGVPASEGQVAAERVVVLRNGHAFSGVVEQAGDRMTITQGPGRSVRIPLRDVDIVVDTLHDAYLHRRQRLRPGEINDQMRLAQWCLRYQLDDDAAELLLEMARRYPGHHSVRALERQMGERAGLLAGSHRDAASAVRTASFQQAEVAADVSGFPLEVPAEPEDAGELPSLAPAEITEFTRVIQPLLQNRCGNANCHAPSGRSAFVLQRTPTGRLTFKDLTWSNLRAAWKQVDVEDPDRSRLVVMATTPHGGQSRAPLETYETRPRQRLARWVASAVRDDAHASGNALVATASGEAAGEATPLGGLGMPAPIAAGTSASGTNHPAAPVRFGPRAAPLTPLQRLQAAGERVAAAKDAAGTQSPREALPAMDGGVQRASFLEADPMPAASPQPARLSTPAPDAKPAASTVQPQQKPSAAARNKPTPSDAGDPFDPDAFNARFHPE